MPESGFIPKILARLGLRQPVSRMAPAAQSPERIVRLGCPAHNCGGRCLLIAHIQDGKIVRLETDDRPDPLTA